MHALVFGAQGSIGNYIFNEFNKMRILNFQTYKYVFDSIKNAI